MVYIETILVAGSVWASMVLGFTKVMVANSLVILSYTRLAIWLLSLPLLSLEFPSRLHNALTRVHKFSFRPYINAWIRLPTFLSGIDTTKVSNSVQ